MARADVSEKLWEAYYLIGDAMADEYFNTEPGEISRQDGLNCRVSKRHLALARDHIREVADNHLYKPVTEELK